MKKGLITKIFTSIILLSLNQESFCLGPSPEGLPPEVFPIKNAGQKCSLKTLKGTYLYAGEVLDSRGQPEEQSGIEYYDGKGNITGKLTAKILPDTVYSNYPYTATYEVNADCTGKIYNKSVLMADIYVSPDGKYYTETLVMKGTHASGTVSRVTKNLVYGLMPTESSK